MMPLGKWCCGLMKCVAGEVSRIGSLSHIGQRWLVEQWQWSYMTDTIRYMCSTVKEISLTASFCFESMIGIEGEQVLEYESVRVVDNRGQVDDEGYI